MPIPLLWKMILWLLLHLACLAIIAGGVIFWQFRSGIDGLLRGALGDRLRAHGEQVAAQLRGRSVREIGTARLALDDEFKVESDLWLPHGEFVAGRWPGIPESVMERLQNERAIAMPGHHPPDRDRPPPGEGPPPFSRRPGPPAFTPVEALFIVAERDAVWAAVHIPLQPGQRPDHLTWVIRSNSWSGNGLFFDTRPLFIAFSGVVVFSILFWTPFAFNITRYVKRLKSATEQIAGGSFDVSVNTLRRDELGSLGEAITHMARRIDQLLLGQKRFLGDVAHELCSPLARLRVGLGILENKLPDAEKPSLAGIEEEARELAALVDELLAFSRSTAAVATIALRPVALRDLLDSCRAREIPDHACRIEVPETLAVLGEERLLQRAIGNILRNIRNHAGPGARVHMHAGRNADTVTLVIADNGPGVPAAELDRIFEPFYRVDATRTRDTGGTGLGLAIVHNSIKSCGGTIRALPGDEPGLRLEIRLRHA